MTEIIIGHDGADQGIKRGGMIHIPHVRDLVENHGVNGILRILHQTVGKTQMHAPIGIFAARTETLFCGGI